METNQSSSKSWGPVVSKSGAHVENSLTKTHNSVHNCLVISGSGVHGHRQTMWVSSLVRFLQQLLRLCVPLFAVLLGYWYSSRDITMAKPIIQNLNVFSKPLAFFSNKPMTGFYRDGYCRTSPEDFGNHAVAGVVTDEFLRFSASRGNDLRSIPGMEGGCKWCLCTSRWKEALDAYRSGQIGETAVPRVFLHATERSVLDRVGIEDLRKFAADEEAK